MATIEGEAGYLFRLPGLGYSGAGPVVDGALGLGGMTVGSGGMWMFKCVHAFGCQSVRVVAEGYRPWLLSDWTKEVAWGGRLTYALYVASLSVAMYGPENRADGYRYMVGLGVQLPY